MILTGSHRQVELGLGHEVDIRTDKAGRLALADERRCSSDNCLSTRYVHGFEEEPCAKSHSVSKIHGVARKDSQILDEPLHDTQIIEHLNECNEENDSGQLQRRSDIYYKTLCRLQAYRVDEEPVVVRDSCRVKEEGSTLQTLSQEV